MWTSISELVLKNRIVILLLIVVSTVFMANEALDVKFSFDRAKILPSDHQVYLENLDFQEKSGSSSSFPSFSSAIRRSANPLYGPLPSF